MNQIGILLKPADGKVTAITASDVAVNPPALSPSIYWIAQQPQLDSPVPVQDWSCLGAIAGLSDNMPLLQAQRVCQNLHAIIPFGCLQSGVHLRKNLTVLIPGIYRMIDGVPVKWTLTIDKVHVISEKHTQPVRLELLDRNPINSLTLPLHTREKRIIPQPKHYHRHKPGIYSVLLDSVKRPSPLSYLVGRTCLLTNDQLKAVKRFFNCRLTDSLQFTGVGNRWLPLLEHPALRDVRNIRNRLRTNESARRLLDKLTIDLLCNNPHNPHHPYGVFLRGQMWVQALSLATSLHEAGHTIINFDHRSIAGS